MGTFPTPHAVAYQVCLQAARQQAPLMAKRWYTALLNLLSEKATAPVVVNDKTQLHEAWLTLKKYQAEIELGFGLQIAQAIEKDAEGSGSAGAVRSHDSLSKTTSSLRFQDLELMGDDQVQDTLDEARLAQTLLLASEAGLTGLSARLSTAQGFKVVKSDKNPLRPEVYANALVHVLQALPVETDIRTRWLIYGGQIMGDLLQELYVQLDELLEAQGVQQAGYAVVASPDEPKRFVPMGGSRGGQSFSSAEAQSQVSPQSLSGTGSRTDVLSRDQLLTLNHLHRLMSGDYNEPVEPLAGAADVDAGADFGALLPNLQLQDLERPTLGLGKILAAQVVRLMIEQLTSDTRLLAPVRQLLARMEPAFLRLGSADPSFLIDKNHPARGLLEAVTAKSLAFVSEADEGFGEFMQDLQASAERLAQNTSIQSLDFAALLKTFEERQTARNQAVAASQKLAVKALMQAEQRHLLAEKIALEIRQRRDFAGVNAVIAGFVTGPWAQVMAHERLAMEGDGSTKRKAVFSLALGDLLWSADVAQATRHRKWLTKVIPSVTEAVREGLLSIDYPLSLSKPFFDELMRLHDEALRAPPKNVDSSPKAKGSQGLPAAGEDVKNGLNPWLQPSEAKLSGFMHFADTKEQARDEAAEPTPDLATFSLIPTSSHAQVARPLDDLQDGPSLQTRDLQDLQLGIWVELVADNRWVRAQLTWVSPHGTLFMFTSAGGRCHSMTTGMLQQLAARDRFRFISRQGLLETALDGVAQTAMRNSVLADGQRG